uniref:Tc1-like transposase DDE domain-containing protein n=1 Tax=Caenorhabditis japonica TaxID=281687 RepID=A0A8R1I5U4_CAEJA
MLISLDILTGTYGWSPDLNPVNFSVWGMLERKIAGKLFATVDDLKAALEKSWADIDDENLRRTVDFANKRLRACIKARGSKFEYRKNCNRTPPLI